MLDPETETGNENTQDWRYSRRNPLYEELNEILDESHAVKKWVRGLRGDTKEKIVVLRMWLWWLKNNYPELYSLGPDGLVGHQRKVKGTDREFEIPDSKCGSTKKVGTITR